MRLAQRLAFVAAAIGAVIPLAAPVEADTSASPAVVQLNLFGPAGSERFGEQVLVLENGNYVVVDSMFDDGFFADVGAVYLYDGTTDALIDTIVGSLPNNEIGSGGVREVGDSNFVIVSPGWDTVASTNVGAVTWVDGVSGLADPSPSASNSLVGGTAFDAVGNAAVMVLTNGNYVVRSTAWDNAGATNAGAVTWGDGNGGTAGVIGPGNSFVGSQQDDLVGSAYAALSNGNYVIGSPDWDRGGITDAGAATWADGTQPVTGSPSVSTSLIGSTANDRIGGRITPLTNGNYVATAGNWDKGGTGNVGSATWGDGAGGTVGEVDGSNSVTGSTVDDKVGASGVVALTNGNYVIRSPLWNGPGAMHAGAATWADGTKATSGEVGITNSLVGSSTGDEVSFGGVTALSNGNYVVQSGGWKNGSQANAGAATWADGSVGRSGEVSAANSLVGNTAGDGVGNVVTALTNGNYVVSSANWDRGGLANAGAATWADGDTGLTGLVGVNNSLVGTGTNDRVSFAGTEALTNGNYVVKSPDWVTGGMANVGAATWGDGESGTMGEVGSSNSLIGSVATDRVGNVVVPLNDGNYVVASTSWSDGSLNNAGAATWRDGSTSSPGVVSASNSLVGSTSIDLVGGRVTALVDGHYVVTSISWDSGGTVDAGAVTFGVGGTGVSGEVSASNSAIGTPPGQVLAPGDRLTSNDALPVPTEQNRVMLLQIDRGPFFVSDPPDVEVAAPDDQTSAVVTYPLPAVGDVRTTATVSCDPPSGSTFPLGDTTVTCTATDSGGLTTTRSFTVTVTGPDIVSLDPARLLETRPGESTVDGIAEGDGRIDAMDEIEVPIVGRGGVPATGAAAAVINITAVNPSGRGFVTMHPCGTRPLASSLNYGAAGAVVGNEVVAKLSPTGTVCAYTQAETHLTLDVVGYVPSTSAVESLDPARILETRPGESTIDGEAELGAPIGAMTEVEVPIVGRAGVPGSGVSAVIMNVTAVNPTGRGFVTLHPCGTRPLASSLNYGAAGAVVGNEVIAKLSPTGTACAYTQAETHLTFDVVGYVPDASSVESLDPARILETRPGESTIDGVAERGAPIPAMTEIEVPIVGRAGVPGSGVSAVIMNVTAVNPTGRGFVTLHPCGTRPLASSLNYATAGAVVGNEVIAKLSPTGSVCAYTQAETHLTFDVVGYVPRT